MITASPAGNGPCASTMRPHSSRIARPPARWIAPSTPPPPSSEELAALTMASTSMVVMSACRASMIIRRMVGGEVSPGQRPLPKPVENTENPKFHLRRAFMRGIITLL